MGSKIWKCERSWEGCASWWILRKYGESRAWCWVPSTAKADRDQRTYVELGRDRQKAV